MEVYNKRNLMPKPVASQSEIDMLYARPYPVLKHRPQVFEGDAQALFDRVVTHLFEQGQQSIGEVCLYRDEQNHECAVGTLITDADYHYGMERFGVDVLIRDYAATCPSIAAIAKHENLLTNLQRAHDLDNWDGPLLLDLKEHLQSIARMFDLHTDVLNQQYDLFVDRVRTRLLNDE
jgi:hypothetical protein